MSLQASQRHHSRLTYNPDCIEEIILKLGCVIRHKLSPVTVCQRLQYNTGNQTGNCMSPSYSDSFNIQVVWDGECAMLTGFMALAGGLVGALVGGRSGAAIGAGVGGAAGIGMSQVKPLREVWLEIKEKLQELLYIVYNYLRRLDAEDYFNAFRILMACMESRQELVKIIINFITQKLGREVISNLAVA